MVIVESLRVNDLKHKACQSLVIFIISFQFNHQDWN